MASHPAKAMKAYEKAHAWRELFTIAKERQLDDQTIADMVERVTGGSHLSTELGVETDVSDHLSGRGKSLEAAQVFIDYGEDVVSAVDTLTRGAEFAEAYRIVSWYSL
jgi:elongator complex protein 1